jgi:hypothetical protein
MMATLVSALLALLSAAALAWGHERTLRARADLERRMILKVYPHLADGRRYEPWRA